MTSNFLAAIVVTFCAAGQNPASGVIVIDKAESGDPRHIGQIFEAYEETQKISVPRIIEGVLYGRKQQPSQISGKLYMPAASGDKHPVGHHFVIWIAGKNGGRQTSIYHDRLKTLVDGKDGSGAATDIFDVISNNAGYYVLFSDGPWLKAGFDYFYGNERCVGQFFKAGLTFGDSHLLGHNFSLAPVYTILQNGDTQRHRRESCQGNVSDLYIGPESSWSSNYYGYLSLACIFLAPGGVGLAVWSYDKKWGRLRYFVFGFGVFVGCGSPLILLVGWALLNWLLPGAQVGANV